MTLRQKVSLLISLAIVVMVLNLFYFYKKNQLNSYTPISNTQTSVPLVSPADNSTAALQSIESGIKYQFPKVISETDVNITSWPSGLKFLLPEGEGTVKIHKATFASKLGYTAVFKKDGDLKSTYFYYGSIIDKYGIKEGRRKDNAAVLIAEHPEYILKVEFTKNEEGKTDIIIFAVRKS